MNELPEKIILIFEKLDEKIKELYDRKNELIKKAIGKYGITSGVMKIDENEKPYLRVKLVDRLKEFESGKALFSSAHFSRYAVEVSHLKNKPKE